MDRKDQVEAAKHIARRKLLYFSVKKFQNLKIGIIITGDEVAMEE